MAKNNLLSVLFVMFVVFSLQAQDVIITDIVRLKTGDVFSGKIIMQNERILMLQTDDGKRFQFLITDVEQIDKEVTEKTTMHKTVVHRKHHVGISIDVNGGIIPKDNIAISALPNAGLSLSVGAKKAFGTQTFFGGGLGMDVVMFPDTEESWYFLPVYLQINIPIGQQKVTPAVGTKAGYAFSLNKNYKSNLYFQFNSGVNINITDVSQLFVGIYLQQIRINGKVTENNELGKFMKNGNTTLCSTGLKVSYRF